jgi:ribose 5-phosphate isomerase A
VTADEQKKAVGDAAMRYVKDGMKLTLVSTSVQTTQLAQSLGLVIRDINDVGTLDVCVDGADEVGPGLALIKGGGGALLREKLVWESSRRCVVIADAAKQVAVLGRFPLPIEVVGFGCQATALRICDALSECDIGAAPRLRRRDGAPFVTDNGNLIYDVACGRIPDPAALGSALKSVTGVVEHGLFLDLADLAIIGGPDGVRQAEP